MRTIYVSEQKRWEATQARIAREISAPQGEDEDISMIGSSYPEGALQYCLLDISVFSRSSDTGMTDDPLSEENAELEALVSLWESPEPAKNDDPVPAQTSAPPNSGSDDEEYDQLFLDLANQEYNNQDQGTFSAEAANMDTSSG